MSSLMEISRAAERANRGAPERRRREIAGPVLKMLGMEVPE